MAKYKVRRPPKLCYHLVGMICSGYGEDPDTYALRVGCDQCLKFHEWVAKVYGDTRQKKKGKKGPCN